jgi:hypothetical protein
MDILVVPSSLFDNSQLIEIPRSSFEDFTIVVLNDVVEENPRNATDIYPQSTKEKRTIQKMR